MFKKLLIVAIMLTFSCGSAMARDLTLHELKDRNMCAEVGIAAKLAIQYKKVLFYNQDINYQEALLESMSPLVFDLVNAKPLKDETEEAFVDRAVQACFITLNSQ